MELRIDLRGEVADRDGKPPDFCDEDVNRDNRENHKERGQGERDCSRALLSAFSPHLPPLWIQAGPPHPAQAFHPRRKADCRQEKRDIIYIRSGFSSFSATSWRNEFPPTNERRCVSVRRRRSAVRIITASPVWETTCALS